MLAGHSVIVVGEAGITTNLGKLLYERLMGDKETAIAIYKGSVKKFLETIAFELDIPTTETKYNKNGEPTGERALTVEQLKEEIASNCNDETLLILPEAKRLTTSIRFWLEDLMSNGVTVCCISPVNPAKDIFLEMLEIELSLPCDNTIRKVMEAEASHQGLNLNKSRLAELQPLAGRNPMLAKKVIRNEKLGAELAGETRAYSIRGHHARDCGGTMAVGIVRFVGLGTGNKGLYITGGVCLVAGMALKQLGSVRGARKRLGQ
ncbi:MAG: hypothetical protein AB4372_20230 [Xenococcus sp. (in: cyanobacteria)]